MPFYRIFVEKKPAFRVEAESLRAELNENLQLSLPKLRLLNVYDLFGFSAELVAKSKYSVFGEVVTDDVTVAEGDAAAGFFREADALAIEYLPGQFDQRAASAEACVKLLDPSADIRIKSAKLVIAEGASADEMARIRHYMMGAPREHIPSFPRTRGTLLPLKVQRKEVLVPLALKAQRNWQPSASSTDWR